ncbi:4'-phosphopantetheinyl transferase family protein [Candidatus Electronema sp. TJ]|uniref:4'-phosphopantetheinyl transferase family protein n=1 Tax=Candidatus Electronema sp. TJ TaxID=3401573 RepID=UPI003AA9463B
MAEAVQIAAFFPTTASAAVRLRTEKGQCAALVDLEQQNEEKEAQLLSEAEQTFFQQLRHPKRRREWLGGRIAAKAALLNLPDADDFEARARHLTILPNEQGRPSISGGASGLSLSITHSGRYAAALAAQGQSCGIDLQKVSEKLFALISWFAIEEELHLLAHSVGREAAALTMLWSVKEAVKKSLPHDQPHIFAGIKVARITPAGDRSWRFECEAQTVMAYDFSPYILALTC